MANQIETKKITTLTENTDLSDTDQFPFGAGGGSGLRRIKWINIWNKILAKVRAALIIQNATTAATDKVASAAVTKNLQDQITEQNTNMLKVVTQIEQITCTANVPRTYVFPEVPGAIISIPIARGEGVIVTRDFDVSGNVTVLSPVSQDVSVILVTFKK